MSGYQWNGLLLKFEQPGSPAFTDNRDRRTWKLHYQGPYDVLAASVPKWGSTLAGLGTARVENVECHNDGQGIGVLQITLGEFISGIPAKYAVTREEVQKRIEVNPRYLAASGQPGAFYSCTQEMMMWLAQALNDDQAKSPAASSPYWAAFTAAYSHTPADTFYLSLVLGQASLLELWNKIKKGEDSYMIGAPLVTEEKRVASRPTAERIYVVEAPPSASNYPPGYSWIRTKFDADEDWVLFIQRKVWLGVDLIDTNIYH